ncbi:MAG: T9SS type A sorting domain-containing protein, partial [Bacteroidota bacterium]
ATDTDPSISVDCQANIGAYDPNDKMGVPEGLTESRIVPQDVHFNYRVRFQNTGTDTAFNVVVVDTLSPHLDPTSLVMGASSHAYTWTLEGERTLKVTFPDIMLPDSFVNEPASNGFFRFEIEAVAGLPFGTEITNEADIYFDFNEPVRTNQTFHRVDKLTDKTSTSLFATEVPATDFLRLYPQPAASELTVARKDGQPLRGEYTIYGAEGRQLLRGRITGTQHRLVTTELQAGLYIFVFREEGGTTVSSRRFVVR